jgi:hypothetical protein
MRDPLPGDLVVLAYGRFGLIRSIEPSGAAEIREGNGLVIVVPRSGFALVRLRPDGLSPVSFAEELKAQE